MAEHSTIGERERRKWDRGTLYHNSAWPHGRVTLRRKTHGNPKKISVILPPSWNVINLNMDSGNGIAPSRRSLHEYLLAAVPISSYMIISLSIFPTYHVIFVFLRILLFLIHTYWLYLSALITLSLPFFLAFTWNSLALHRHPQNPHHPPRNRRDSPLPWRLYHAWTGLSLPWDHQSSMPPSLHGVTFRGLSHSPPHESCRIT